MRCHRHRVSRLRDPDGPDERDELDDFWRGGPGMPDAPDAPDAPDGTWPGEPRSPGPAEPAAPDSRPPDRLASVSGLMSSVSTAYTAAHGHPLDHDGLVARQQRRRRWAVGIRTAVVAALALALVVGVVVVRDLARTAGAPVPLAKIDPAASPETGTPGAGDDPASSAVPPEPGTDGTSGAAGASDASEPGRLDAAGGAAAATTEVAVHVVGQVSSPGVVEVATGSRVIDAITAAGGLTERADAGAVNLARVVVDGEQIYVPVPGEVVPAPAPPPTGTAPAAQDPGAAPGATAPGAVINLNTADVAALDTLPGIGPAIAGRIVDWRETHGGFAAVDDLLEVAGIGPAVLTKIRDLVTV